MSIVSKADELDLFGDYLRGERRLATNSIQGYLSDLRFWKLAGLDLEAAEPPSTEVLREALRHFEREKLSDRSLARRNSSLRLFTLFRSREFPGWRAFLTELPRNAKVEARPKALSVDEIARLLDFDPGDDPRRLRNRALLELIYASGLRVSEAIALERSAIDERAMLLKISGKGSHERIVPYSERAAQWLEAYWERGRPQWAEGLNRRYQETVFLSSHQKGLTRMSVWNILRARGLEAGVDDVHPHVLRHSFATHLLQGGADVRFVQALLGHRSLNTTETYLKISDTELKSLFEKLHPLR